LRGHFARIVLIVGVAFVFAAASGCGDRRSERPKTPGRDVSEFLPGHGPDAPAWPPSGGEPEGGEPAAAPGPATPTGSPERGASINGTIRLAPGAKAPPSGVLYIIAHPGSQVAGPPLAVHRVNSPHFPMKYSISNEDTMTAGIPFQGEMTVIGRLDADGNASTKSPDDLVGSFAGNPAHVGQSGVDIELKPER
jgi:hypothetical protein